MEEIDKNKYDMASLFLHELGHFIGLTEESDGVMSKNLYPGEKNREISDEEAEKVLDKYGRIPASDPSDNQLNFQEQKSNKARIILFKKIDSKYNQYIIESI